MLTYLGKRLVHSVFVLVGAIAIIFLVVRVIPGDPAALMLGSNASRAEIEALSNNLGLNDPLIFQFVQYLTDVVRLDFGQSFRLGTPAMASVLDRLPATLYLAGGAMAVALVISVPLGILAAKRSGGAIDGFVSAGSLVGQALPQFWVGIMLILIFSRYMQVLPSAGADTWKHLVLPSFALALPFIGWVTRMVRASILEQMNEEYVQTARAKGLSERVVFYIHVLRNALVPVITLVGLLMGEFVGSAVIVEVVFSWPGVGRLMVDSIAFRDYAVVQSAIILITAMYVFLNLAVDLAYGYLDPRIRLEEGR